ncbi:MAG TPA: helix-turn-helix domain-containing protein [Ktedonobacterales bacterium]|nr:helix-turn-helix domain-containing protein [Ktedonobacterales bacterium]
MKRAPATQPTTSISTPTLAPGAFGEALRRYRLARGLTQAELAERAGLSPRGVNDLERGARQHPRRDTIALLADALDLSDEERGAFAATVRHTRAEAPAVLPAPQSPPNGTVTFLFTDIEGSTRLLQRLGDDYAALLAAHGKLLRKAFADHHGYEVDTQGDSFFAAFPTVGDALAAAAQAQRALANHRWPAGVSVRVRMGLHTGAPTLIGGRYVGMDVHRAARVGAAAHGGQTLLSSATAELARGAPESLPVGADLRDLGAHRLKDLQAPERLWQLLIPGLDDAFPPPRTLDMRPHNLPIQPTELLGRMREVGDIARLLHEGAWLVTVTGPPGVGKTRLGLQVAARLVTDAANFPDGVWFVRLSRLNDPALVIPAIAQELGVSAGGVRLISEALRDHLDDKRLLLLLDNFEHVTTAASELAETLAQAPGVRALVTSRAPLRLRGERVYALAPLPAPRQTSEESTPERLATYASVNLFVERAQAADTDFTLTQSNAPAVAAICARLEGLPLALELAAVRIRLLSPEALRDRLLRALPVLAAGPRDAEARQQTMRATLAWSEALLAPTERALFRRLAVFAGGATLAAVEDVCLAPAGAESLDLDALEGLATLVDHSLVRRRDEAGESRFDLLYVVREYALERLEAAGESEALRRAHARRLERLCDELGPLLGEGTGAWLRRMRTEQDNLRVALTWALERGEVESGLCLATGGAQLWNAGGSLREGRRWLDDLLRLDTLQSSLSDQTTARRERLRRWATYWAAMYAMLMGDVAEAKARWERCRALAHAANDAALDALAAFGAAWATRFTPGQEATGYALARESVAQARYAGDDVVLARILCYLDYAAYSSSTDPRNWRIDHMEERTSLTEEGLQLARQLGDAASAMIAAGNLAWHAIEREDLAEARTQALRSYEIGRTTEISVDSWSYFISMMAHIAARQGRLARFARLQEATLAYWGGANQFSFMDAAEVARTEALAALGRAELGEEGWASACAAGRAMTLAQAIEEALREARDEPE